MGVSRRGSYTYTLSHFFIKTTGHLTNTQGNTQGTLRGSQQGLNLHVLQIGEQFYH